MTEDVIITLIICGTLGTVVLGMTTVIAACSYSREIEEALRAWRKSRGE